MGYRLTEEQIKWAIVDIDDSGNGLIGYDEFMKWWKKDERVKSMQLDDEAIFFRANVSIYFIIIIVIYLFFFLSFLLK